MNEMESYAMLPLNMSTRMKTILIKPADGPRERSPGVSRGGGNDVDHQRVFLG